MKLEEAKTMRCPFALLVRCHTTECMAWRFAKIYAEPTPRNSGLSFPASPKFLGYSEDSGYCQRLTSCS